MFLVSVTPLHLAMTVNIETNYLLTYRIDRLVVHH